MDLHQIDLNKLHTFFAIVEHGGISAAAGPLALTPSAVSQGLARLEATLDLQLFDRVGRRLVPTREGRLLFDRFAHYREGLREAIDAIAEGGSEPRGTVRIGLFLGFPQAPLTRFLASFSAAHPGVDLRVIYAAHRELDAGLEAGRVDFAFALRASAQRRSLSATRLFDQELVLVSGKRLRPRPMGFEALSALPIVDYYQSDPLILRWIAHHYRRKAPPLRVRAWAATTHLALGLILQNAGVGVLPRHVVAPYVKRRRLSVLETGRRELRDSIWLKERRGGYRGPALEAFHAAARAAFHASS